MTKKRFYPNSNAIRDSAGVTVTMRHRTTDEPVTVHRGGLARVALAKALEPFDPVAWYVGCVSTPRTILADLKGRTTVRVERNTKRGRLDGATDIERPQTQLGSEPERLLLQSIRRTEYLAR